MRRVVTRQVAADAGALMVKPICLAVPMLLLAAGPAFAAGHGESATATSLSRGPRLDPIGDARQVLTLSEGERDKLTAEMRDLLDGTQQIVQGIADNNMKVVAKAARLIGAAMMHKVEDEHGFPPEFMQLGTATHADFDRIAVIAERGGGAKQVAAQLGATLNRCVACHSTWRVRAQVATPEGAAPANHESHH